MGAQFFKTVAERLSGLVALVVSSVENSNLTSAVLTWRLHRSVSVNVLTEGNVSSGSDGVKLELKKKIK